MICIVSELRSFRKQIMTSRELCPLPVADRQETVLVFIGSQARKVLFLLRPLNNGPNKCHPEEEPEPTLTNANSCWLWRVRGALNAADANEQQYAHTTSLESFLVKYKVPRKQIDITEFFTAT